MQHQRPGDTDAHVQDLLARMTLTHAGTPARRLLYRRLAATDGAAFRAALLGPHMTRAMEDQWVWTTLVRVCRDDMALVRDLVSNHLPRRPVRPDVYVIPQLMRLFETSPASQ